MKTRVLVIVAALATSQYAAAETRDSITVAGADVTLGMSPSAIRAQLADGHRLAWHRENLPEPVESVRTPDGVAYKSRIVVDGKEMTLTYDDHHGEHAYIADATGVPLAALVFEAGKLTRATRFVALPDEKTALTASGLMAAVAPILASWGERAEPLSVRASHLAHGVDTVDEMIFESGSRQLVLLTTAGRTSIVENLGRGDLASISMTP